MLHTACIIENLDAENVATYSIPGNETQLATVHTFLYLASY